MKPAWMDPTVPGPTALCVTNLDARKAHWKASDTPGDGRSVATSEAFDEARKWCARCEVRSKCLEFALAAEARGDAHSRGGVYGGLGPAERATSVGAVSTTFAARPCHLCGEKFEPGSPSARYCSDLCKRSATYRRQNEKRKEKRARAREERKAAAA